MKLNADTLEWFANCREEWYRRVDPLNRQADLFGPVPEVPLEAVRDARLFANRTQAIASLPKGATVAEVGVLVGEFSKAIWSGLKPAALHLFDLHYDRWKTANPELDRDPRVTFHVGDSSTSLLKLPDDLFDVIYIDGDHSEGGVRRDTEAAIEKLKPEGFLVFDDYTMWSPIELLDYGVVPVVNNLLSSGHWIVQYLALDPFMYCNIALRRSHMNQNG